MRNSWYWLLGMWCWLFTQIAVGETPESMRLLLEKNIQLAGTPMQVRAWVNTRQLFQQQALHLWVQVQLPAAATVPSLSVRNHEENAWNALSMADEPEQIGNADQQRVLQWHGMLFAKQTGIWELPSMQLQLVGRAMAKQTLSLPNLSIQVLPVPIYVPAEAIVANQITWQVTPAQLSWPYLVGDVVQRQVHIQLQDVMEQQFFLTGVTGTGIEGLSSLMSSPQTHWQEGHRVSSWSIWQPWRITQMGFWQVDAQDIWLFNAETWQVTHIQLPAQSGWALSVPVWWLLGILAALISVIVLYWLWRRLSCWIRRMHYRRRIAACEQVVSLYDEVYRAWRLQANIPLAHQAKHLPIYSLLCVLEQARFSSQPLPLTNFLELRTDLQKNSYLLPC